MGIRAGGDERMSRVVFPTGTWFLAPSECR